MCDLSGEGIDRLARSLAGAVDLDNLSLFVHVSTGDRLFVEYVTPGKPLRPTIVDLLNALQERGITDKFLRHVYVMRPGKPALRELIAELCPPAVASQPDRTVPLSAQTAGKAQPDAPNNALAPGLQRNVRPHLAKLDVRVWLERLVQIERRVCRVEMAGAGIGTAFLIGPDVVLTNWHVIESAKSAGQLDRFGCRFDFVKLPNGSVQAGQLVGLHADGCLASSPYSDAEKTQTPETPPPTAEQLDYALLRLATAVGRQEVAGQPRGWIVLPGAALPLAENAPLLIVQHPEGVPMKLALDTQAVIGANVNGTRLRYRTNTDPGSSGSPCFTMDWDIVALHHYGDPAWQNPLFNQGVPIGLIRASLEAKGLGASLGS